MNTMLKIGAAGILALSYASAHAGITGTKSSTTPGDLLLFADVISSSGNVVGFYVGDTNVPVGGTNPAANLTNGTLISASTDSNLQALLTLYSNTAGGTLDWGVQGGGADSSANFSLLTTVTNNTNLTFLQSRQPTNIANAAKGLYEANLNTLVGSGKSFEGTTTTNWDPTLATSQNNFNLADWLSNATGAAVTGFGQFTLYGAIANGFPISVNGDGLVTLNASGLSYSSSAVPLPAAIWLLGSGLLGLAGIGRRKAATA